MYLGIAVAVKGTTGLSIILDCVVRPSLLGAPTSVTLLVFLRQRVGHTFIFRAETVCWVE